MGQLIFKSKPASYNNSLNYLDFKLRAGHILPLRYYQFNDLVPVVLICHDFDQDIGDINVVKLANKFKTSICTFDYAGYGLHTDKELNAESFIEDGLSAYDYLVRYRGHHSQDIIILGIGYGSGVACELAYQYQSRLILLNGIMSVIRAKLDLIIYGDIFLNYELAPKILSKVLLLCDEDRMANSFGLAELFPNVYKFVILKEGDWYQLVRHFVKVI